MLKCAICGTKLESGKNEFYSIYHEISGNNMNMSIPIEVCSPSCLVDWAWCEKDSQTKLSKSKQG